MGHEVISMRFEIVLRILLFKICFLCSQYIGWSNGGCLFRWKMKLSTSFYVSEYLNDWVSSDAGDTNIWGLCTQGRTPLYVGKQVSSNNDDSNDTIEEELPNVN